MKRVTLLLIVAVLLSSGCATYQACVNVPVPEEPNMKAQGFVLTDAQDKALCELDQAPEQKANKQCGDIYDVMADREITHQADGQRLRDLLTSVSCK